MENRYNKLVDNSLSKGSVDPEDIKWILTEKNIDLLSLLSAVYQVRYRYFKNKVRYISSTMCRAATVLRIVNTVRSQKNRKTQ